MAEKAAVGKLNRDSASKYKQVDVFYPMAQPQSALRFAVPLVAGDRAALLYTRDPDPLGVRDAADAKYR